MIRRFCVSPTIIVLLALSGCAKKNEQEDWLHREFNRGPADALKVVHIDTETESYAGFPVRLCCFVTANRPPILGISAVIEGYASFVLEDETKRLAAGRLVESPWVILASRGVPELPNRIDPTIALEPGAEVAVGGFFLPPERPAPIEFADIPPSVVTGRLLAPAADITAPASAAASMPAEPNRSVGVLVPPGDYRGFLGGPAARKNADETYTVWGVIVSSETDCRGTTPVGTVLRVERLPDKIGESREGGEVRKASR